MKKSKFKPERKNYAQQCMEILKLCLHDITDITKY